MITRLAKTCRRLWNVRSVSPAFYTARSKTLRNKWYGTPSRLQNTCCVVDADILMTLRVSVKSLFIGTLRLSPFLAYAAGTVITPRRKSTSSQVRDSSAAL
jgi:hypothetical protein